jgi:hypothetical protein
MASPRTERVTMNGAKAPPRHPEQARSTDGEVLPPIDPLREHAYAAQIAKQRRIRRENEVACMALDIAEYRLRTLAEYLQQQQHQGVLRTATDPTIQQVTQTITDHAINVLMFSLRVAHGDSAGAMTRLVDYTSTRIPPNPRDPDPIG